MGKHDDAIYTSTTYSTQWIYTDITSALSGNPYVVMFKTVPYGNTLSPGITIRNPNSGTPGFMIRTSADSAVSPGLQIYGYNSSRTWVNRRWLDSSLTYLICVRFKNGIATYCVYKDAGRTKVFEESCTIESNTEPLRFRYTTLIKVWDKDVYDRCKQEIANGKY